MNVQIGLVDLSSHPSPEIQRKSECVVIIDKPNKAVKRERHPIPTVEELMDNMDGAVKYSKVDLKAGYHQVPLAKDSRSITTFTTHQGLFRYKRLPFGINAASEVFQNAIQRAIQGLDAVKNIADDIIVWCNTQQPHDQRVEQLFARLQEKNLTVNPDQCLFNQTDNACSRGYQEYSTTQRCKRIEKFSWTIKLL